MLRRNHLDYPAYNPDDDVGDYTSDHGSSGRGKKTNKFCEDSIRRY